MRERERERVCLGDLERVTAKVQAIREKSRATRQQSEWLREQSAVLAELTLKNVRSIEQRVKRTESARRVA